MKAVLVKWKDRKVSIAGKINIVKSLVTSKLVYAMTNLPSPDQDYWKEVNHLLYKFLYNEKSEKIKREILIGPYETGGHRMIDLQSQNQALKITWMTKLLEMDGFWKSYVINKIPMDIRYMARCNITFADLPFKFPKTSIWNEVWLNWCIKNFNHNVDTVDLILNQNLWLNSHIRKNKKPIHLKDWERQGIRWISDLLHENEADLSLRFLNQQELEELYQIRTNFVTYWSVIQNGGN